MTTKTTGRQYREYRAELFQADMKRLGNPWAYNPLDLTEPEKPQDGDMWGRWRYQKENLTLQFERRPNEPFWYEVDLERMKNPAVMLDIIFQFSNKNEKCVSRQDVGDLIDALNDLLEPQGTLCSFGVARTLDVTSYLRTRHVPR